MRDLYVVGLATALSLAALPAAATKPARACIAAHAEGQVDRDAGRLLRASEHFRACAMDSCPAIIRQECAELGVALSGQMPSLVVRAEDGAGNPIAGASATVDEKRMLPTLDGAPLLLDPGVHQVDVALLDGRRQRLNLSLSFGEKERLAVARFELETRRPARPSADNTLAYIIGGAGILGLGAWGAFAWDGRRRQGDLETCAPRCTDRSEVDAMRRSYLVADILLGLSAAAVGTSAYLLITNTDDESGMRERSVVLGARGRF